MIAAVREKPNSHFRMWQTATASDATGGPRIDLRDGRNGHCDLRSQVSQYATPTASNKVRSGEFAEGRTQSPAEIAGGSKCLNPRWVEWLMGFPIGWTSLDPLPPEAMEQWADPHWWLTDPADEGLIPRVSANEPNRAAQLKALGNAQVPLCAAAAWNLLSDS